MGSQDEMYRYLYEIEEMHRNEEFAKKDMQRGVRARVLEEKKEADERLRRSEQALAAENINRIRAKHGRA